MNYKIITISLALIFLFSTGLFASETKKAIAVLPFRVNNIDVDMDDDEASHAVARMVADSLEKSGITTVKYNDVLKVMDNLKLKEFPEKKELQEELAKELNAQYIVTGWIENIEIKEDDKNISDWWDGDKDIKVKRQYAIAELRANLIDGSTLTVMDFLEGKGTENKFGVNVEDYDIGSSKFEETIVGIALKSAVAELAEGIIEHTDKTAYQNDGRDSSEGLVAYVDGEEVVINTGSEKGVKEGDIFNIIKLINITDPETGTIIKVKEEIVAEIHIFQVELKSATGKVQNLKVGYSIQVKDRVRKKI
ncbi:MAG: FlgT C-terminal domain-containing protein [Candidatus Eremiobacterota bacterium]